VRPGAENKEYAHRYGGYANRSAQPGGRQPPSRSQGQGQGSRSRQQVQGSQAARQQIQNKQIY